MLFICAWTIIKGESLHDLRYFHLPEAVVVIPLSLEVSAVRSAELWLVGVGADAGCEFGVVLGGGIGLPSWLRGGVAAGVCKCGTAELVGGGG